MGHPSGSTALLTPSQLKGLEKHKYSVECQSLLDPIMQKWYVLCNSLTLLTPSRFQVGHSGRMAAHVDSSELHHGDRTLHQRVDFGHPHVLLSYCHRTCESRFDTLSVQTFDVSFASKAPCLVTLWCAIGLFIYQTLDAIDGKQARRTNSSSPLGELFDHGCDSLSTGNDFFSPLLGVDDLADH